MSSSDAPRYAIYYVPERNSALYRFGTAVLGYALKFTIGLRAYWGRGYGTDLMQTFVRYLFETMPLDRIYLKTLDWNVRAQRCFENAGFQRYGTSRRGEYNFILMEIRRETLETETPTP